MIETKIKELMNRSKFKIQELRNRQKLIENNDNDAKKLNLFLESCHKKREQLKHSNGKPNHEENSIFISKFEDLLSEIDNWLIKIDKNVDRFFEEVYDKIPGYIFGIIGIFTFIFSTLIAVILYLQINPNYSIFHNWISDLGTGPNGANIIFNTGWIVSSGIILFFHVYEIQELKKKINQKGVLQKYILHIMPISNIAFTVGIFLVGFFPENLTLYHIIAANFYFYGGFSFFSLYGISAFLNKHIPRTHVFLAFIICIAYILFFFSPYFPEDFSNIGLTITSTEWLTLFTEVSMMLVILQHSLVENYYLRKYEREKEYIKNGGLNNSKFRIKLLKYLEEKSIR